MNNKVEEIRNLVDHPVESKLYDLVAANNLAFGKVTATRYSAIKGAKVCEDVAVGFLEWYMTMCREEKLKLDFTTYEEYYPFYIQNIFKLTPCA